MKFKEGGQNFRIFHTEGIKHAPVDENIGQTFVLMIASHDRVQQLVGVAGNAVYLGSENYKSERERIADLLELKDLWRDLWMLPKIQSKYGGDVSKFQAKHNRDFTWVPN